MEDTVRIEDQQDWVAYGKEVKAKWVAKDWTVGDGFLHWFAPKDCAGLPTCYGNNPASPYGLPMLPRGVNETDFSEWGVPLAIDGHSASWRLQANEALVIFGTSPPEMRYWGVTNYLFSRFYEDATGRNNTLNKVSRCPDPPARCVNFASVGDTMNMINSNLTATP